MIFTLFAAELGEDAQRALRVQEADLQTLGAGTALLVDQAHALLLGVVQRLVGVLHGESHVVHTAFAAVLLDKRGNGAVGAGGLEQLNLDVAAAEEGRLDFLVLDFLDGVAFQAQDILVVADSLFEVCHGDADVFNV